MHTLALDLAGALTGSRKLSLALARECLTVHGWAVGSQQSRVALPHGHRALPRDKVAGKGVLAPRAVLATQASSRSASSLFSQAWAVS